MTVLSAPRAVAAPARAVAAPAHAVAAPAHAVAAPARTAQRQHLVLRDGSPVLIRQVQRTDGPLLADGFTRLSAPTRRMQFPPGKDRLTDEDLRTLTDIDHREHGALVALSLAEMHAVGVAWYSRRADDLQAAEVAIALVDDWQGRGLGTQLLARLAACAHRNGIRRFTALVAAENVAMLELLRTMDPAIDISQRASGAVACEIVLAVPRCALCQRKADPIVNGAVLYRRQRQWICDVCVLTTTPMIATALDRLASTQPVYSWS